MFNNKKIKDCSFVNKSIIVFSDRLLAIVYAFYKARQSNSTDITIKQFYDYYNKAIKYIVNNSKDYIV